MPEFIISVKTDYKVVADSKEQAEEMYQEETLERCVDQSIEIYEV